MKKKLLIVLASFAILFSSTACTKPAEKNPANNQEQNTETKNQEETNQENAATEDKNFVNVDENDKKEALELVKFLSTDDFSKIKERLHEEVKEYQNDESYELNNNVFKDTGEIGELEALTKQERKDEKVGEIKMYSGQVKGEHQDLAFDIIVTKDGKFIDWRFFPVQDQEANMKKHELVVKKFEEFADLVESGDYEKVKPELALMEMDEEAHKNFKKQLDSLVAQVKNRKEFKIVNIVDRTAVKSLEKIGVTGKIVNIVAVASYEEGPQVQYRAVYSDDGRLLSIGLNPIQMQPQMEAPKMPEDNNQKSDEKTDDTDKKTE